MFGGMGGFGGGFNNGMNGGMNGMNGMGGMNGMNGMNGMGGFGMTGFPNQQQPQQQQQQQQSFQQPDPYGMGMMGSTGFGSNQNMFDQIHNSQMAMLNSMPSMFGGPQNQQAPPPTQQTKSSSDHKDKDKDKETLPSKRNEAYDYDVFLSHYQKTGADLAQAIKLQLHELDPTLRIFLDVDDLNAVHNLEEFVKKTNNFVLLITEGVLQRPFVQKEIRAALSNNKNIVLVHDQKGCDFPAAESVPEDIRPVLLPLAVPYYRPMPYREVSMKEIFSKLHA